MKHPRAVLFYAAAECRRDHFEDHTAVLLPYYPAAMQPLLTT